MKRYQFFATVAVMMTALLGVACSSTNTPAGSAPLTGQSTNTLTISPNAISVAAGGSTTISVNGGTSPYQFSVVNGIGSIYQSSETSAVYTAPASGATMAQVTVTDAAGNTVSSYITIGGTGGTTGLGLSVSPLNGTVTLGGTLQLMASGGTAPYYYIVTTPNAGSFSATGLYTAPNTAMTVNVTVYDSVGASVQTTIVVGSGGSQTNATVCSGTFVWSAGGYGGSLTIVQDSSTGKIAGGMTWNGYQGTDYIQGTCSSSGITFTPAGNGQTWTGTLYTSAANPSQVMWMGTISGANATWSAVKQ